MLLFPRSGVFTFWVVSYISAIQFTEAMRSMFVTDHFNVTIHVLWRINNSCFMKNQTEPTRALPVPLSQEIQLEVPGAKFNPMSSGPQICFLPAGRSGDLSTCLSLRSVQVVSVSPLCPPRKRSSVCCHPSSARSEHTATPRHRVVLNTEMIKSCLTIMFHYLLLLGSVPSNFIGHLWLTVIFSVRWVGGYLCVPVYAWMSQILKTQNSFPKPSPVNMIKS